MRREDFESLLERLLVSVVDGGSPPSIKAFQKTAELRDAVLSAWDAQAAEFERERMRLAACGVVALADTPESAARARDLLPEYRSASCDDVARMVDRLMDLRAEVAALRTGVPLTTDNAPRARVVECEHCAFIVDVGDDGTWWCNGWGVGVDYLIRNGATVLAWRTP